MRDGTHKQRRPVTTRERNSRRIDADEWRQSVRPQALNRLIDETRDLDWSQRLINLLLEELHFSDDFDRLFGQTSRLPRSRYPQALAIALVLRHSFCPQDFARTTKRLGLTPSRFTRTTDLTASDHSKPATTATGAAGRRARRLQGHEPSRL